MTETITPHTAKVGLIGWPVEHSGSPRMHNAALRQAGLDWAYLPLPVSPERVREAVLGLRALGFRGANVTIPHKREVIGCLSRITETAAAVGAVNTITVTAEGELHGDNTDVPGFLSVLLEAGWTAGGHSVLVMGAGGSARSVVHALAQAGCHSIKVANRTVTRAEDLVRDLARFHAHVRFEVLADPRRAAAAADEVNLVVNTTSLGMHPHTAGSPLAPDFPWRPGMWAYDLVYNPATTQFLAQAQSMGAHCIGGLEMLVRQGAQSFEIWTGRTPDLDIMRRELRTHLGFETT